jgi:bifunctional DNA-binding transcriptional regulator/antitoxin component of YhaV-PrlF toxin-antitoxin module
MATTFSNLPPLPELDAGAEGELRERNQLTLPKAVADALGARPGDRFMFYVPRGEPDAFIAVRIRDSYAGALRGLFGTPEETQAYVEGERQAWEE